MIASKDYRFPITEEEHVALIRGVPMGDVVLTTIGSPICLIWQKDKPLPSAVKLLAEMRGVALSVPHEDVTPET